MKKLFLIFAVVAIAAAVLYTSVFWKTSSSKLKLPDGEVVFIGGEDLQARGTGVLVGRNFVLTARHVVFGKYEEFNKEKVCYVKIGNSWQRAFAVKATRIISHHTGPDGIDLVEEVGDLALLRINTRNNTSATIAKEERAGESVIWLDAVSVPRTEHVARVSEVTRKQELALNIFFFRVSTVLTDAQWLVLPTRTNPGSSGSPVFNNKGEVVGIISQNCDQGQSCAIGAEDIRDFLKDYPEAMAAK